MAAAGQALAKLSGLHIRPALGVACMSKRHASDTSVVKGQTSNLAAYKRGTGGRSSFSGVVATVFGASGFVGSYVVNRLGKIGSQVICPYRADPYHLKELRLMGDLGQILFLPYNLRDEESIRKAMKYSNVVVNLVGREWDTKNFTLKDVNVDGARRLARIAKEMGVEKFIHISHLNAAPELPTIYVKGGSEFLKSKHHGEEAVRREFPEAIVLRPADIFGSEDRFLTYYGNGRWRSQMGFLPLWKKGTQTIKRPVFVSDVADAVVKAILNPEAVGQTYQCIGPNAYYLSDLVDYFLNCMRWETVKRGYITPLFTAKVRFNSMAPTAPTLTIDKLDREHQCDELNDDLPTIEDLGVKLTTLESRANWELKPFRAMMHYEEEVGEFAIPNPPPTITRR